MGGQSHAREVQLGISGRFLWHCGIFPLFYMYNLPCSLTDISMVTWSLMLLVATSGFTTATTCIEQQFNILQTKYQDRTECKSRLSYQQQKANDKKHPFYNQNLSMSMVFLKGISVTWNT